MHIIVGTLIAVVIALKDCPEITSECQYAAHASDPAQT